MLQDYVVDGVKITSKIVEIWRDLSAPHAVWRYLATESGIIRIFPGIELNKFYDPRLRSWLV